MIGVIPNPTKTVQVNYPFETCQYMMDNFQEILQKFQMTGFELETKDSVLNTWTYKKSEVLSLGSKVIISLQPKDEQTIITIEVQRTIGAFDKSHEITFANAYITDLFRAISMTLNPPSEAEQQEFITKQNVMSNGDTGFGVIMVIVAFVFVMSLLAG